MAQTFNDVAHGSADGDPGRIIDVQWVTPHLASMGVTAIPRSDYIARLGLSLSLPLPAAFDG